MKLHLDFAFESSYKFKASDHFFLIGSCFSENISGYLSAHSVHHHSNPFGILFEPLSIARSLEFIADQKQITASDLVLHEGYFHSRYHHGVFSGEVEEVVLNNINHHISLAGHFLKKTNLLIITFGSAFAWKSKSSGIIYANCHKIPGTEFEKIFLEAHDIIDTWSLVLEKIKNQYPQLKIAFTVSPVRYLKDGLIENNRSKASLITAIHQLKKLYPIIYFPSYEFVIDVLRDYRFFKEDMLHPNDQALKYVWELFKNSFFEKESIATLDELYNFHLFTSHKPLRSPEKNMEQIQKKRVELKSKYPEMNWE